MASSYQSFPNSALPELLTVSQNKPMEMKSSVEIQVCEELQRR
jgi:hypothetical protein